MSYTICFVVTNGIVRRKFLWIVRRASGIYLAFAAEGELHHSYHKDGKSHWKIGKDKITDLRDLPPLDSIVGATQMTGGGFLLTDEALQRWNMPEFSDEQVDQLIYLDNRRISSLSFMIFLVQPRSLSSVPVFVDKPCSLYLSTHSEPWLAILLIED